MGTLTLSANATAAAIQRNKSDHKCNNSKVTHKQQQNWQRLALNQLASKANLEDVYTKSQTYTKSEVDTTFAAYVGGRKAYTTLALAQADQANLPANTAIKFHWDTTSNNGIIPGGMAINTDDEECLWSINSIKALRRWFAQNIRIKLPQNPNKLDFK